ncbi:MAG: HIT domain-containing protein [Clostridia bacterium]|jgi:histidine triad (HIT) family protein|nr:HIT domain-containing protein [Clostridia bacterium]MDD4275703.1 HIT domain-containing protein [Clostridia bacterium]
MKNDCIFCAIGENKIKSEKLYEDENCFIIKDINPICKYHYLMIPKMHYATIKDMPKGQAEVVGKCIALIPTLSKKLHLENGYRLIVNQGEDAGQGVMHLHIHILSGQKMNFIV